MANEIVRFVPVHLCDVISHRTALRRPRKLGRRAMIVLKRHNFLDLQCRVICLKLHLLVSQRHRDSQHLDCCWQYRHRLSYWHVQVRRKGGGAKPNKGRRTPLYHLTLQGLFRSACTSLPLLLEMAVVLTWNDGNVVAGKLVPVCEHLLLICGGSSFEAALAAISSVWRPDFSEEHPRSRRA